MKGHPISMCLDHLAATPSRTHDVERRTGTNRSDRSRRYRSLVRWVGGLAALSSPALACTDARQTASDVAAERVRTLADRALDVLEETAGGPEAPRGQELIDEVRPRLAAGTDVVPFEAQVDDDGLVTLRVAFHARGEAGGGLTYEAVWARLCVELTAEPGPPVTARMRDTSCPRRLPEATRPVDVTVRLRE
jgi:hypothetical protein